MIKRGLYFKLFDLSLLKDPRKDFVMDIRLKTPCELSFRTNEYWDNRRAAVEFEHEGIKKYMPIKDKKCDIPEMFIGFKEFYITVIGKDVNDVQTRTNRNKIVQTGGT